MQLRVVNRVLIQNDNRTRLGQYLLHMLKHNYLDCYINIIDLILLNFNGVWLL